MNAIKDFLIKTWGYIGEYVKIHFAGLLLIVVAFILLSLWLLPKEKQSTFEKTIKNEEIARNYDERSKDYKDIPKVNKLGNEIEGIKSEEQLMKLVKVFFFSFFLAGLVGFLGNFIQYIYTVIPFAKLLKSKSPPDAAMRVLSTALQCATIIVCVAFVMVFSS